MSVVLTVLSFVLVFREDQTVVADGESVSSMEAIVGLPEISVHEIVPEIVGS